MRAAAWYVALTLVMTWPIATGLFRDVPSDHGDPLLNAWILAWNIDHFLRALGGDLPALGGIWHANTFHPASYTLAFSELLITQSLLGLPVYALTRNILFTYNVLFLAAFVLSGVGMYLFVRAITHDWRTAFVSGLLFAFTPYRLDQAPHLQVMWSCWMPFVLLGIRRYFDATEAAMPAESRPRRRPALYLAGAALAFVAQNLSCGYYLLFFPPFVTLYALYELVRRRRLADWRAWMALSATALVVAAATVPFMLPYLALEEQGVRSRGIREIASFSADAYAYFTANSNQILWRWLEVYPRAEGRLFPGLVPIGLTAIGLAAALTSAVRASAAKAAPVDAAAVDGGVGRMPWARARHVTALVAACASLLAVVLLAGVFLGLEGKYEIGPISVRLFSAWRPFVFAIGGAALTLALSRRARTAAADLVSAPVVWAIAFAALAAWLSLGPLPSVGGDQLRDATIYPLLYKYVPGFDGLRVPARFAMIVMLALAWGASSGWIAIARHAGTRVWPIVCVLALVDAAAFPIPVNGRAMSDVYLPPPATVPIAAPPLQRAMAELPPQSVVVELPFGDVSWEIRYVYLSMFHWRPLVNGYSGHFPPHYLTLRAALGGLPEAQEMRAWPLLAASGATHAVVHGEALGPDRTARMREWLERHGARLVRQVGDAYLYAL
jgi:hypothetical protein